MYHLKCSCGRCYIGETLRLIHTRLKEHLRCTYKFVNIEHSAVAGQSVQNTHEVDLVSANTHINYVVGKILKLKSQ